MGKKIKNHIDWSLDKGNSAGDVATMAQIAHTQLGTVLFPGQTPLYEYHADMANSAFRRSFKLHNKVLELPIIGTSNQRYISDTKLLESVYLNGCELTLNICLMFEHLTLHILIICYRQTDPDLFNSLEVGRLEEKLIHILKYILNAEELIKMPGYGVLFSDVKRARDAINHPKGATIYSVDESTWDTVPIAWFVSGKHLDAFSDITKFHTVLIDKWTQYAKIIQRPGTIKLKGPLVFDTHSSQKKSRKDH